jgi:hypothetical protein
MMLTAQRIQGTLLTQRCTTGWLDWIHGQIWLFPEGLLWARGNLQITIAQSARGPLPDQLTATTDERELAQLAREKGNLWIPSTAIRSASIRRGLTTERLLLTLVDGSRIKLLWPGNERVRKPLEEALASWGITI